MGQLDVLFVGSVMNYDGKTGSFANYIRQGRKWIAPFQYIHQKRPEYFRDEAHACVYDIPNLSICKLVDHVKRHVDDFRFHIVWQFDYHKDEILEILRNDPPHLVAMSTTLAFYPRFLNDAIAWVKQHKAPQTKVVLGGKWIFDQHKLHGFGEKLEEVLVDTDTDYAVINGFGEETFRHLLLAHRDGDPARARSLPNLAYRKRDAVEPTNGRGHNGKPANGDGRGTFALVSAGGNGGLSLRLTNPGDVLPAYDGTHYRINRIESEDLTPGKPMIDFENIGDRFLDTVVHVRTCSSCPFKCKFCTFPVLQGEHVLFDIDDVMVQLRQLKEMGVTHLFFIDDTFNVPRDRFEVLMDRMIEADLGMKWVSFFRAQFANQRNVHKMYEAGCRMVFCGFESGNDRMLKLMGKNVTVAKYKDGLKYLSEAGIEVLASYIIGYPGETHESAMDTLALVDDPRVGFSRGSLFYYDPNAPVREIAGEWELTGFGNEWSHKTMNSTEASRIHLEMISKLKGVNTPVSDGGAWSIFNLYARGLAFDDIKALYREFTDIQRKQFKAAGDMAVRRYRAGANKPRKREDREAEALVAAQLEAQDMAVPDV